MKEPLKTIEEARELARTMVDLGNAVGRKTIAVLTDMSQPLGTSIGNRLEILEALDILQGKGREDVTHFICELAQIVGTRRGDSAEENQATSDSRLSTEEV